PHPVLRAIDDEIDREWDVHHGAFHRGAKIAPIGRHWAVMNLSSAGGMPGGTAPTIPASSTPVELARRALVAETSSFVETTALMLRSTGVCETLVIALLQLFEE